ncbi:hypothetical protein [Brachyspira pilosicoli]|uniref:hypothetical protein n=1 Tax=Brachyspira pilosicoli TaxID=52584 RepID=UPI000E17FD9B|nr:hypothetical protein [Brachyspira pilosicoli]SUW05092.1 Uncharacterised protein [Brachyspira pilosicoli]
MKVRKNKRYRNILKDKNKIKKYKKFLDDYKNIKDDCNETIETLQEIYNLKKYELKKLENHIEKDLKDL